MKNIFKILFLSNMMEEKGVWILVDACKLLVEHQYSFECHFVGKWSDITEDKFTKYIKQSKLEDKVFAYGGKYGKEKTSFFEQADVFVLPTFNECFPIVLLEAMQHGKACIASNEGGIQDIIDNGKTGFIVEKKNPMLLANKIEILLNDFYLCKQMGKAGYEKYQANFTISHFEHNIKNILELCCN